MASPLGGESLATMMQAVDLGDDDNFCDVPVSAGARGSPSRVRDAFGFDGNNQRRMKVPGADGTMSKYLSSDHDPLFRFQRWRTNLRILEVAEIKQFLSRHVPTLLWNV
jgi:hypothetical protein